MTAARNAEEPVRGGTPETGSEKKISPRQALAPRGDGSATNVAATFLDVVVGDRPKSFLTVAYGYGGHWTEDGRYRHERWREAAHPWPAGRDAFLTEAATADAAGADVYLSAALRFGERRQDTNALPLVALWADLDRELDDRAAALLEELDGPVVGSGRDGHRHAYVLLSRPVPVGTWRRLARVLRDRLGGDAKIATNDLLRLPGTHNRKTDPPGAVTLERTGARVWEPEELAAVLGLEGASEPEAVASPVPVAVPRREPVEGPLPPMVRAALERPTTGDRSDDHHRLVAACRDSGLTAGQALTLAAEWPPSVEKYGDRLAAEVARSWANTRGPARLDRRATTDQDASEDMTEDATEQDPADAPTRRLVATKAAAVKTRRIRWVWESRVVLGGLTLLAGREGLGKSTLAVDLAAQVTRGELPGEFAGQPRTVIYLHSEDARDFTVVPRLRAAGADLERVLFLDARTADDGEDRLTLPRDVELLEAVVREHDAGLVILDAATSLIDGRLDGDRDRQMRQGLEPIGAMADRARCAVLGLVHFSKRDSRDTGRLILGSIAWSQVARSVLAVARDEDSGDLVVSVTKANLAAGDGASLGARLVDCPVETEEGVTHVGRVEWLGETDRNATELLADGTDGEDRADRTRAEEWLEEYLTEYDRPKSAEVKRAAREADVSERTLQRARKKLGVRIETEGTSASGSSGPKRTTIWTLPASGRAIGGQSVHEHGTTGTTGSTAPDQHERDGASGTTEASRATGASGATPGTTGRGPDVWRGSGEPVRSA